MSCFTTQVGSGHCRPLAPFALALQRSGHTVAFASSPIFCFLIAEHGFRSFPVWRDDWLAQSQQPAPAVPAPSDAVLFAQFIPRAARDLSALRALVHHWRPDLIVRETTEFAACVAVERAGLPHAAVQISAFRPHSHPLLVPSLDRLRARAGLPPDPALAMLYRYLLLTPFPPRYQDPTVPLPPTAHAVRHISYDIEHPGDLTLPGWIAAMPRRPTVYATLGTAYNRTPDIFATILAALRDEPINLIVTLGPGHDSDDFGAQPPHVHLERCIPQSLLFPHCDLVITHGGSGTVRTALAHGLPMVIIPIAADQPENAQQCAALGLARIISSGDRTATAIREATRTVLSDPRYRQNAARLHNEMESLPGPEYAVALLERLARATTADRNDGSSRVTPTLRMSDRCNAEFAPASVCWYISLEMWQSDRCEAGEGKGSAGRSCYTTPHEDSRWVMNVGGGTNGGDGARGDGGAVGRDGGDGRAAATAPAPG